MISKTQTGATFGAIMGALLVAATWASITFGEPASNVIDLVSFLVVPVGLFLAQFYYRSKATGAVGYGDAYGTGFLTVLFAALVAALGTFVLVSLDPTLTEAAQSQADAEMRRQNMPQDQREIAEGFMRAMFSPIGLAAANFFSTLIWGSIVALITSIFTRKSA